MKASNTKFVVLGMSLLFMGSMVMSPLLGEIAKSFPDKSQATIQMISTSANLFVILTSLAVGVLATIISKKSLISIGLIMIIIASIGGFLFHQSIGILYFWSAIYGISMGLYSPTTTLIINDNFEGMERGNILGLQASFVSVGAVILSLLSGLLSTKGWHFGYLTFTILAFPLLLIVHLFLRKDYPRKTNYGEKQSIKINWTVIFYTILVTTFMMFYYVYVTNVAMFTLETGLGSSATAGLANSVASFSGILGGILFGKISSKLEKKIIPLGFFLCSFGLLITYMASNLTIVLIGAFIGGMSISLFMAQVMLSATNELADEYKTMGISIIATFPSLGAFLSPLIFTNLAIATGNITTKFRFLMVGLIALVFSIIISVVIAIHNRVKSESTNHPSDLF